jgi:hypothetical protein
MALRKKLHNELVDLKGNIRVYCRVRPLLDAEDGEGEAGPVVRFPVGDEKITLKNGSRDDKTFTYEKVFQPRDDQPAVFAEIRCASGAWLSHSDTMSTHASFTPPLAAACPSRAGRTTVPTALRAPLHSR